nr:MAG TPA: hypothetical protein [Caudoviricetes sp.]
MYISSPTVTTFPYRQLWHTSSISIEQEIYVEIPFGDLLHFGSFLYTRIHMSRSVLIDRIRGNVRCVHNSHSEFVFTQSVETLPKFFDAHFLHNSLFLKIILLFLFCTCEVYMFHGSKNIDIKSNIIDIC